ncbi:hypothetical protein [Trichloromonas sp.]|uniref:hypothetical protein n=1 Tax=Trichloromonas sp. TaxID=3069249 RepID=UPI002A457EB8|nr:hypothetical protein [Trichloromonas sp.]
MTDVKQSEDSLVTPKENVNLEHLEKSLNIMDRHAAELAAAENDTCESLRKWDREHKDEQLHSVPRPRKHMR